MRLFIALIPDEPMKDALATSQNALRQAGVSGSYTKRENLHLTLAFLGECESARPAIGALSSLPFPETLLRADGFGCFGKAVYAGMRCPEELRRYVSDLKTALRGSRVSFDEKPFRAHVTLVRCREETRLPRLAPVGEQCLIRRVSLMRSERTPGGMVYTEIFSQTAAPGNAGKER